MRRTRLYAVPLIAGMAMVAGCAEKDPVALPPATEANVRLSKLPITLDQLDKYLTDQYKWESEKLFPAICQLEEKVGGLVPAKKICPNGGGGGGNTTPPKYPP